MTEQKRPPLKWHIHLPPGESPFNYPSLVRACHGNARIAELLAYFIYEASKEADRQKLTQGCKVVTFTRIHKDILDRVKISEKTLITYLRKMHEWGYVTFQAYRLDYTVSFEAIDRAITTPPAIEKRTRTPKGCKVVNLQSCNEQRCKVEELQDKVVNLQRQVEELQDKVVNLQTLVVNLQPYNMESRQDTSDLNDTSDASRLKDCNRLNETKRDSSVANAIAPHANDESREDKPVEVVSPKDKQLVPSPKTPRRRRAQDSPQPLPSPELAISPEGRGVFEDWCSLFKVKVPLGEKTINAAEQFVEPCAIWTRELGISRAELLKNIKDWLYRNDKSGYYSRGVKLTDCWREFEAWQSAQERPKGSDLPPPVAEQEPQSIWSTMTKAQFAAEFYPSEAEKRRIASYA